MRRFTCPSTTSGESHEHRLIASGALASVLALGLLSASAQPHTTRQARRRSATASPRPARTTAPTCRASHSCAGQSKDDEAPDEWKYVAKGTCKTDGRQVEAEAQEDESPRSDARTVTDARRCSPRRGAGVGIGLRQPHYASCCERAAGARLRRGPFRELLRRRRRGAGRARRGARALRGQPARRGPGARLGGGLDAWHLDRLARLVERIAAGARLRPRLLRARAAPAPARARVHAQRPAADRLHADASLGILCANVQQVQERLRRPLLVENLSAYLSFAAHDALTSPSSSSRSCRRTGCGLLLDVNNLVVNALNAERAADPRAPRACAFVDALPRGSVGEIHLAGYCDTGGLVIDDHGSRVREPCGGSTRMRCARFGARAHAGRVGHRRCRRSTCCSTRPQRARSDRALPADEPHERGRSASARCSRRCARRGAGAVAAGCASRARARRAACRPTAPTRGAIAERALAAAFPTVRALVGDEDFARAGARVLARRIRPSAATWRTGATALPDFIAAQRELADVAVAGRLRAARRRRAPLRGARPTRCSTPPASRCSRITRRRAAPAAACRALQLLRCAGRSATLHAAHQAVEADGAGVAACARRCAAGRAEPVAGRRGDGWRAVVTVLERAVLRLDAGAARGPDAGRGARARRRRLRLRGLAARRAARHGWTAPRRARTGAPTMEDAR